MYYNVHVSCKLYCYLKFQLPVGTCAPHLVITTVHVMSTKSSYFPVSSYPLATQIVSSDEPMPFDNSSTESRLVSVERSS